MREASIHRVTGETDVQLSLNLDAPFAANVELGDRFLNNTFGAWVRKMARGMECELNIQASGDIQVDYHHLVEDVALVLGEALSKCLGARRGINRYGFSPLDRKRHALEVAVDLGARSYLVYNMGSPWTHNGDFDLGLIKHFFRSLCDTAGMNLHINQTGSTGIDALYTLMFRTVGESLKMAIEIDPRTPDDFHSSKGMLGM